MGRLVLQNAGKTYHDLNVVQDINLDIEDGEFVVIVGPSGSGKSTLLRMIAGLEDISAGEMFLDGQLINDTLPQERSIGMVFQSYALYPHMTVEENMAYGLTLAKCPKKEITRRVHEAANILQLTLLLERKPAMLSGGQRQRVAIGRALVKEPALLLFDEPLSNLDAALRVEMRVQIARLHQRLRSTMIYVTHDQVEAMTLADRIVMMSSGRIAQVGTPLELYHRPATLEVATFIGSPLMNILPVTVEYGDKQRVQVRLPDGVHLIVEVDGSNAAAGEQAWLGVRPEHLVVGEQADALLSATVVLRENLGHETLAYYQVEGSEETLTQRIAGDSAPETGSAVQLGVNGRHSHLFTTDGRAYCRL
ncbi:sn-glycerol-3-phosphate ABC transporter ATP-binding protein UgpC [Klebsiella michiganensis]|uniref:ABC transporter ATP-binding protein n=1 Tax=Klebsiella michiganensis TaxID=1134687 RepID=UPI0027BCF7E9|nr:sn-glycerol-3-phosphate ABC transporter ATP-binding protein UgpC [Klebsiella michiganensis]MDQ2566250.1 sn-glycerol-3-phosphate ABC transporter ATP-binding protein UgpC [Klebsiella michiganensis]